MRFLVLLNVTFIVLLFVVKDSVDYQGRSYLHVPHDIDIRLDTDEPPERCFLPKKHIHTWLDMCQSLFEFLNTIEIFFIKEQA